MSKNYFVAVVTIILVSITAAYGAPEFYLAEDFADYDSHEFVPVLIIMENQLNLMDNYDFIRSLNKTERRNYSLNTLMNFSRTQQKNLDEELRTSSYVKNIRNHWLINAIGAEIKKAHIQSLLSQNGVKHVIYDPFTKYASYQNRRPSSGKNADEVPYHLEMLNLTTLWDQNIYGDGVIVAVVDSGVNYNHHDLIGRMWENLDYPNHGYNVLHQNHDTQDLNGHGTHCAGIVAGTGASGTITGVAPGAKIMSVVVLDEFLMSKISIMVEGVEFALENGADVLSLSIITPGAMVHKRAAWRQCMDNVLAVGIPALCAAGNDGFFLPPYSVAPPASCPPPWLHPDQYQIGGISGAIAIGALDENFNPAYFTSRGPTHWSDIGPYYDYHFDFDEFFLDPYNPDFMGLIRPDVSAGGVDVISLDHSNESGYIEMSGTSMATPAVAGVTALMLSVNPDLTPEQICQILEENAYPLTPIKDNFTGSGLVDALSSVNASLDKPAPPVFLPPPGHYNNTVLVSISTITPNALILYTLDNTEPEVGSDIYSEPLKIDTTTVIKAKSYLSDDIFSDTASAKYVIETSTEQKSPLSSIISYNIFPNPAVSDINLYLTVKDFTQVEISIFNVKGQKIETFGNNLKSPGDYYLSLKLSSLQGITSGIYFLSIKTDYFNFTEKLLIMR